MRKRYQIGEILPLTKTIAVSLVFPAAFSATHSYVPLSCSWICRNASVPASVTFAFPGRSPPILFHDIEGGGTPVAAQMISASELTSMKTSRGLTVMDGRAIRLRDFQLGSWFKCYFYTKLFD